MQVVSKTQAEQAVTVGGGRWATVKEYVAFTGLSAQTLANWRYRDSQAGRTEAQPGFPRYRRFGGSVRYWLAAE
jgi:hypothetical protein